MAKTIVEVIKSGVDASLDELVKEIWGEEAVEEVQPESSEEDLSAEVQKMTAYLNRIVGIRLTAQLCGEPSTKVVKQWLSAEDIPNSWQLRFLRQAYEVTSLLMLVAPKRTLVREWWLTRNGYLAGYAPIILFPSEPLSVRMAAADFLMRLGGLG